jgi:hypothetical protein
MGSRGCPPGSSPLAFSPLSCPPSCCRAHGVSNTYPSLLGPGDLNEGMLRGLDYFLAEAGRRGIKARSPGRAA